MFIDFGDVIINSDHIQSFYETKDSDFGSNRFVNPRCVNITTKNNTDYASKIKYDFFKERFKYALKENSVWISFIEDEE